MWTADRVIELAVPLTYGLSALILVGEYLVLRVIREPIDQRQGLASLGSGLLAFGALGVANRLFLISLLHLAWEHRLLELGAWAWPVGFVAYDLMFYVAHRLGHELRLLWCFHSVHHTSEEMRLTSAIRGSALDFVYLPWFFIWIPILGVHPAIFLVIEAIGRVWGVLVHVHPRFVGKLGWLDRWLVTPSFHRVHHGRNHGYLDRNYGEVLPVWDHLFGTYEVETEAPDYGVLKPIDAGSLREIQLSPWSDLWRDLRRAPSWTARLRYLFDAPGWDHEGPDQRVRSIQRGS